MPSSLACCRRQWMVPGNVTGEHGGLVDQVWVEILPAEGRLGSVRRRVRQD